MVIGYRVLVTGSRMWTNIDIIHQALDEYVGAPEGVLVSGACPQGADYIAEQYAYDVGWMVEQHPAEWELYGKQAGYIRNSAMVHRGADVCLAFIKDKSRGATMTARLAQEAGIETLIFSDELLPEDLMRCWQCPGCAELAKGLDGDFVCHRRRFYSNGELEENCEVYM